MGGQSFVSHLVLNKQATNVCVCLHACTGHSCTSTYSKLVREYRSWGYSDLKIILIGQASGIWRRPKVWEPCENLFFLARNPVAKIPHISISFHFTPQFRTGRRNEWDACVYDLDCLLLFLRRLFKQLVIKQDKKQQVGNCFVLDWNQ